MDENNLTTEDLNRISKLQAQKDHAEHYTERPLWHRIFAWILIGIVTIGIAFYCYWLMLPQA